MVVKQPERENTRDAPPPTEPMTKSPAPVAEQPAPSAASPIQPPSTTPGQLNVIVDGYRLTVTDGTVKASPVISASDIRKITRSKRNGSIRVDCEWSGACGDHERSLTFFEAFLEARLENQKALKHHREQRLEEAAKGFERAARFGSGIIAEAAFAYNRHNYSHSHPVLLGREVLSGLVSRSRSAQISVMGSRGLSPKCSVNT